MSTTDPIESVPESDTKAFPKDCRLRSAADFKQVYERGVKRASNAFVLFALPNGCDHSRFGLTTPRRLGKAHERNRIKRRVREILRTSRRRIPTGFDFVVNPKRSSSHGNFQALSSELLKLLGVGG